MALNGSRGIRSVSRAKQRTRETGRLSSLCSSWPEASVLPSNGLWHNPLSALALNTRFRTSLVLTTLLYADRYIS